MQSTEIPCKVNFNRVATFLGEIVAREKLPPENYLNKSVSTELQLWLRSLLEWDPNLRGRDAMGEVSIFKELGAIMEKVRALVVFLSRCVSVFLLNYA